MFRTVVLVMALMLTAGAASAAPMSPSGGGGDVPGGGSGSWDPTPKIEYRPPVDAPVSDPFRAPSGPYGPGNRGLEYATAPGTPATSIGPGIVVFAGPVAGRGVVTVLHPDGLRSSLTGLVSVTVRSGEAVVHSSVLGVTGTVLHLGVRRGEEYLDPALLFGVTDDRPRHAILVPVPRA